MLTLGCVVMAEESGSRIDRPEHYRPTRALHAGGFAGQDELFTRHEVIRRQIEETRFRTAEAQLKLAEAQNATELKLHETSEKLDALIKIADEWTRNRPNAPNQEAY